MPLEPLGLHGEASPKPLGPLGKSKVVVNGQQHMHARCL
jgi:hypothetical protein